MVSTNADQTQKHYSSVVLIVSQLGVLGARSESAHPSTSCALFDRRQLNRITLHTLTENIRRVHTLIWRHNGPYIAAESDIKLVYQK